jgi:thiol-disulfide isomerase/thioredoxin
MKKKHQRLSAALFAIVKTRSFIIWIAVCLASNLCFATTFDVAADFSATNNPNGVWSYGWSSTLTSAFNLYPNHGKFDEKIPVDVWAGPNLPDTPIAVHNGSGSPISHPTIIWQPGQFSLHPGQIGEYSHARWTAPDAGIFDIDAMFTGIDLLGTTTDVYVLHNGISIFDGLVNGLGNKSSFSTTVTVGKGDIIDFAVGYGNNQSHTCDTTALSATISKPSIEASVDIEPDTPNLGSKGQKVTIYITLPSGVVFFNNHCYKVFSYPLSWEEAKQACEKMGGYMACITNPEENNFIINLAGKISFSEHSCLWIGGRKNPSTGAWEWNTGESLGMRDNLVIEDSNESYLNLRLKSGLWEDYPLRGEKVGQQGFVCEWSSLKLSPRNMQFNPPMTVENVSSDLKGIAIGKPFPELEFNDLNGTLINISKLKGKVVLIDFWATWCGPCKRETPELVELYSRYHKKGFEIIGISLDFDINALKKFLISNKVTWPQYFERKGWDNEIASRFGIDSIPSTLLLDKDGNVIGRDLRGKLLREKITELLNSN